ncbi:MAG: STAS domain-containing protein [Gammaproteobacteria bacterium]|nr:STAS domain-containing protein [Gammaproteobacteria bacterium]MCZ6856338.1 STAS domain-containing protein [Gammaproteobacteria bacterium]
MKANGYFLPDKITLDNIAEVRASGERHITGCGDECTFDLSGLKQNNSLTVALLMAWFRHAHVRGKSIVCVDVPEDLRNIIDVCGLTEVIPIKLATP